MAYQTLALCVLAGCSLTLHHDEVNPPDAPIVESSPDATVVQRHWYVIDQIDLARSDSELGRMMAMISGAGFDVSAAAVAGIHAGTTITLVDFVTDNFASDAHAAIRIMRSTSNLPPKLDGTDQFLPFPSDDSDLPEISGLTRSGVFTTTEGDFHLHISLGVDPIIDLPLTAAHIHLEDSTANALGGPDVLAGALRTSNLDAFETQLATAAQAIVARDCHGGAPAPCGCAAATAGNAMIDLFDSGDCVVTKADVVAKLQSTLTADVALPDNSKAYSAGFGIHAVAANLGF